MTETGSMYAVRRIVDGVRSYYHGTAPVWRDKRRHYPLIVAQYVAGREPLSEVVELVWQCECGVEDPPNANATEGYEVGDTEPCCHCENGVARVVERVKP